MTAEVATTPDPVLCPRCERVHGSCNGHNRQGGPCGNPALPGAPVCHWHGGEAPQVKRKAALRLLALVDPAIATLAKEMTKAEKSADRQRAANSILDRAGVSRTPNQDAATARTLLVERLIALRDAPPPELEPVPDGDPETFDAELVEEPDHD